MLRSALFCRPWSSHEAKVAGYEPLIRGKVERVSRSRRNCWRSTVYVDDCPMTYSHHDTKAAAESGCARMLEVYTDIHYVSR
jgi:hypothetical protein